MGVMTLQDFRNDLLGATGREIETVKLDRWINAAMWEFGYAFKFHFLEGTGMFDTEAGRESYTLGDDFRVLHENGLMIITPEELKGRLLPETRVNWKLYRSPASNTLAYGVPRYYHTYAGAVVLRQIPDAIYTVEYDYWKKIPKLANDTDVSLFDEDWDDIIFTGALYRGFRAFGEFDRYKNVRNDFIALIRSRVMDEDLEEFPEGGISLAQGPDDSVRR